MKCSGDHRESSRVKGTTTISSRPASASCSIFSSGVEMRPENASGRSTAAGTGSKVTPVTGRSSSLTPLHRLVEQAAMTAVDAVEGADRDDALARWQDRLLLAGWVFRGLAHAALSLLDGNNLARSPAGAIRSGVAGAEPVARGVIDPDGA